MRFDEIIVYLIFFGIPIAALVWFIRSLVLFANRDKSNVRQCKGRLVRLIISAVSAGVLVLAVVSFMVMLMFAISHM